MHTQLMPNAGAHKLPTRNDYETFLANFVTFVQEWMAVTFQLVCISRLEETAGLKSSLVLFLTLVVFTGPFLNAWLLFIYNIWFKSWYIIDERGQWKWEKYRIVENIVMGFVITGANVTGSDTAYGSVTGIQPNWNSSITWESDAATIDKTWGIHFGEEMLAVASLLIGCVYLLWLKEMRRAKPLKEYEKYPKIEITFYFHLTLLVTAASQAFPSAYLSPHVLFYKLFMQKIPSDVFWARLGGGGVGLGIACVWRLLRVKYRDHIQDYLDPEHDHNVQGPSDPTNTPASSMAIDRMNPN